jgi:cation:H+ antiporter
VAAGTSVPELVTSFIAAIRKKPELALGNVLGSNVFNSFAILGITSMVVPQRVVPQTLRLDTPVMLGLSLLLAGVCMFRSTISRKTGGLLLLVYCAYIVVLLRIA